MSRRRNGLLAGTLRRGTLSFAGMTAVAGIFRGCASATALAIVAGATVLNAGAGKDAPFEAHAAPEIRAELPEDPGFSEDAVAIPLAFPGHADIPLDAATNCWMSAGAIEADIFLPAGAPSGVQLLFYFVDEDHNWFQYLDPTPLTAGAVNRRRADLSAAAEWEPRDHHSAWHHRVRLHPRRTGMRLFAETSYRGTAVVARVRIGRIASAPPTPPRLKGLRVLTPEAFVHERYELSVVLPDRYDNPFDPAEIELTADFDRPDGVTERVAGFYYRGYYRRQRGATDRLIPQGAPEWRIRYAPAVPGAHTLSVQARDRHGETRPLRLAFEAAAARRPGSIRVSRTDPRFFEFDDGSPFFPAGHNLRSPFDDRMNTQFPWRIRHDEGPSVYERFFGEMQAHGANLTEIWMAPWSFGIEWSRTTPGYHGIGQYNLRNSWQLDRIFEEAERRGIYILLAIHNHGKFSTHWDPEWDSNPYNRARGGYLETPEEYFENERAIADFKRMMGYIIARWGYSPAVFSWKLWNELDLTGSRRERVNYRRPEVVEWHRRTGAWIRQNDPRRRLVATHFCGDYTHQHPPIIELDEIDLALVDAYHGNPNPMHIVQLMQRTAEFNNPYGKPVLITEFGGSPLGATLGHIEAALHAGLWSSVAVPLGGAPMLWWWGIIEEERLYPVFRALNAFMEGEDRRNPDASLRQFEVRTDAASRRAGSFQALCFTDGRDGLGWLTAGDGFAGGDTPETSGLKLTASDMQSGGYAVEFWDTRRGIPITMTNVIARDRRLTLALPPFAGDLAFKLRFLGDTPDSGGEEQ